MKRVLLFLALGASGFAYSQEPLTVDDFLQLSSLPQKRLENYITKKGFLPAGRDWQDDNIVDTWEQRMRITDSARPPVTRRLLKFQNEEDISFAFQTSSREEYGDALSKLKEEGFTCAAAGDNLDTAILFQKKNITVQGRPVPGENTRLYGLFFQQKKMPSSRSVLYAEDLLQFTSHEYLSTFFGAGNVRKDVYYFSEKEMNRCSVLFPNTPRQAVFIWEDETNLVGLSHVIIGGAIPTAGSADFNRQIRENNWMLENGVHFNMKLDELIRLNGEDLSFYGRDSKYFLSVVPEKRGEIDFSSTGVVLDCINCAGSAELDERIVSGTTASEQSLNLHVGMIILTPNTSNPGQFDHSAMGRR